MALAEKDIRFFLSGGAGNSDPNASLGGLKSTTELKTKNASKDTNNITGVVLRDVSGDCPDGSGTGQLSYANTGTLLKFKKPGGTLGAGVDVGTDGVYQVYDTDTVVFAIVEVTAGSLPGTDQDDNVTVAGPLHYLFDAIMKSENWYGDEEHRCIFLQNGHVEDSGTAESGGNETLTDTDKTWGVNAHTGRFVEITGGTGLGQIRQIVSNTETVLTVGVAWDTNPDATSEYKVWDKFLETHALINAESEGQLDSGTATAGTASTLSDSAKGWDTNEYADQFVRLMTGTGLGQSRKIVSNTGTELTITPNWTITPDTDTTYQVTDNLLDLGFEDCAVADEEIDLGDDGVSYGGTLIKKPLQAGTFIITDELAQEEFTDYDGDGTMTGSEGGSGTINYTTGVWTVTYNAALADGTKIYGDYIKWPQTIADEGDAPSGVTFTHPVTGAEIDLGDIQGNERWRAVWLKWRVRKAAERLPATGQIKIDGRA